VRRDWKENTFNIQRPTSSDGRGGVAAEWCVVRGASMFGSTATRQCSSGHGMIRAMIGSACNSKVAFSRQGRKIAL